MFDPRGRACAPRTRTLHSSRFPGALNEKLRPFAIDGVPPAPVDLQRAGDDDAVDDGENVADVVRINAAADERRKRSGRPDLPEIVEIGGVTGALAGEDDDIGVEKLDVANELGDLERELHLHRLGPIVRELKRVTRLSEWQGRRNQRLHIDHTLIDILDRDPEFLMKSK